MRDKVRAVLDQCPAEVAIAVIGGSWKISIVKYLADDTLRFGELARRLSSVTPRMLTRQLRELEQDGIVTRTVYRQVPPKVEYSLTDTGRTLVGLVGALDAWGAGYAALTRVADPEGRPADLGAVPGLVRRVPGSDDGAIRAIEARPPGDRRD